MDLEKLKSVIESLLFISGEPVALAKLVKITGAEKPEVENALMVLRGEYSAGRRGFAIFQKEDEVQITTNPENASFVDNIIKSEVQGSLSRAALEVLSIAAYRGPMSRVEIEAIRGVNCSFVLRNLLMRGLLERTENLETSRGYLYKISFDFLKKMGMESVQQLPDFESLSKDDRIDSIIEA